MEYRKVGIAAAEIVTAWADCELSDSEAWSLLTELRQSWESHLAFLRCRNEGQYRDDSDYIVAPAPALKRSNKVSAAIGAVLLGHRINAIDPVEAEDLLAELVEAEATHLHAERLLADRANRNVQVNRITDFAEVLDGRD